MDSEENDVNSPFRVLGVALVVDKKGKGARTILRYPSGPLFPITEDLFFRLQSKQIAKLFRPKPALCGQPMTLSIGGTVFCCQAILMDTNEKPSAISEDTGTNDDDHLVLFSLIVALEPNTKTHGLPIAGWFEDVKVKSSQEDAKAKSTSTEENLNMSILDLDGRQGTPIFESIRRIHLSLVRLCRVLQREERRCQYVSLQTKQFSHIKHDFKARWIELKKAETSSNTGSRPSSVTTSPVSIGSRKTTNSDRRHTRKQQSVLSDASKESVVNNEEQREYDQELLDIYMAAPSPMTDNKNMQHHGNLAREIAKIYHALSRNDHDFLRTQVSLLQDEEGTVFINRHIAVSIEPASLSAKVKKSDINIRPYHTLLFPNSSAKSILETLSSSNAMAPRRMNQFLDVITPHKSLKGVTLECHFPIDVTLELASYLVQQGVCVISPVISHDSRFACVDIEKVHEASLSFVQSFGMQVDIFVMMTFLTDGGRTLGEALSDLRMSNTAFSRNLRESLLSDSNSQDSGITHLSERLESRVMQMASWLCSQGILVHLEEYLIGIKSALTASKVKDAKSSEKKSDTNYRVGSESDDSMYQDLLESECLTGKVSLDGCALKTSIEKHRLRAFAERHAQIRILRRIPSPEDDT